MSPTPPFSVRPAEERDLSSVASIDLDAGRRFRRVGLPTIADAEPTAIDVLRSHLADATVWVAQDAAGTLVGYAHASEVDGQGHLDQVSVVEAAAGHAVGQRLIDAVHRWATGRGFSAVTLTTFVEVPWNGPYYRRLGYRVLRPEQLGAELAAIRSHERAAGIDVAPRCAMRVELRELTVPTPA